MCGGGEGWSAFSRISVPGPQGWGFLSISVSLYCGNQTLGGLRQRCPAFPPITADLFLSRDASRFK